MLVGAAATAGAQNHPMHGAAADTAAAPDMMMTGPLGISTDRQGSGTAWVPEDVQLPARHALVAGWDVMSHWNVWGQYIAQRGPRGDTQVGSINWLMVMASRPLLGGRVQLRAMHSVEPATVGRCGYPHLLQTGETCHGEPNVDRQHPHDFFMETGVLYEHALSRRLAWSLYAAPAGEPALGPTAFMHRPSAMNDPMSNITHHWQDATHITFGVVSGAIYTRQWKVEGSAFNGREPDEHRWNFELKDAKLTSRAGRLTIHPSTRLSISGSFGRLVGVEPDEPEEVTQRAHASVLYSRSFGAHGIATALIWGANRHHEKWEHSALAEADVGLSPNTTVFGRAEWVRKSADDLVVPGDDHYPVSGLGLGFVREVGAISVFGIGVGARANVAFIPESLRDVYESRYPAGLVLFVRARAKPMTAEELRQMHERMGHARMKM